MIGRALNPDPSGPDFETHSLQAEGLTRSYLLRIPPGIDPNRPAPLVLVLHGGGGNAGQVCRRDAGVSALADEQGFIVACPQGVESNWNDGRRIDDYQAMRADIDDVGFLQAVVADIQRQAEVDRQRVYATGMSNGGMMTLRLACDAAGTFAAAAAVIANLPAELDCRPSRPMPVLMMNGTKDPLMPWDGGQVHFFRRQLGLVLSTEATLAFWSQADECSQSAQTSELPDIDPADGTRVSMTHYTDCAAGSEAVLYTVEGGGHTLPGGDQYLPAFLVGRVSRDLDGAMTIWQFLAGHRLP